MRHWLATVALVGSAVSAQTFVVDAANGPGTNFTTIAAAVAAVPDGSTLIVRAGVYGPFVIHAKGLTLLGGTGVRVSNSVGLFTWSIEVGWTTATQPIVLCGMQLSDTYQTVQIHDCAGPVLVDDLTRLPQTTPPFARPSIAVSRSMQVLLRGIDFSPGAMGLLDSNVAIERCTIRGTNYWYSMGNVLSYPTVAVTIQGGSTQIVASTFTGGNGGGGWLGPNCEAIVATNTNLRIRAPATLTAGGDLASPLVSAISGTGTLRIDPAVVLVTGALPQIGVGLATQTAVMPAVLATSASPGGTFTASALGPVGSVVILILGLGGPPVVVPGIADTFWIDPAAYYFAAFGVPQPAATLVASIAIPGNAGLLGVRLAWQSVSAGANGFEASNPTMSLVR